MKNTNIDIFLYNNFIKSYLRNDFLEYDYFYFPVEFG